MSFFNGVYDWHSFIAHAPAMSTRVRALGSREAACVLGHRNTCFDDLRNGRVTPLSNRMRHRRAPWFLELRVWIINRV
jgi:hypothetical protein